MTGHVYAIQSGDLISDTLLAERRERRLRIVVALASDFAIDVNEVDRDALMGMARHYRLIVDALESMVEPTEGDAQ